MVNNLKLYIMNLGTAVKTIRNNNGLKQNEFAERLGITQAYLSQIENNKKKPSLEVIEQIATSTNTPIPVLFWFSITEKDVSNKKLDSFKLLKPIVDKMLDSIFN